MTESTMVLARCSGNVFGDFEYSAADVRQAKALMGAQIIRILDREGLSTRQAEAKTGVKHSEFSRIRRATFSRFTIDRLISILHRLDRNVEVTIDVHPKVRVRSAVAAPA